MADTIPAITFDNQLAYDVIVYDSFDYDDDDSSDPATNANGTSESQAYFATLTQIGKVPAGSTVSLQPIHDSSAFVVENASDSKPIKRIVALSFDDITSLSIAKDDEAAMNKTFQFISFFLNNVNDPLSVAFNKVLNGNTDDFAGDIDSFFEGQPDYSICRFENYMMALAYTALHPSVPNPAQPPGTSSLKMISDLMGAKWPELLSDIFVTKFTCTTQNKLLILTFEVDVSTLPFESAQIASNVLALLNGTKVVKAQIFFNYAIGLSILGTRLSLLFDALTIPTGGGKTYSIKKPQATIDINPLFKFVVFTMKATFPFNINGKTFDALASFVIDNEEVAIGVDIQGDHSTLPAPPGIKGLHFDEFGVGMAMFFKPPGFGLGIQGKFHVGEPNGGNVISLNDDTFALVCEFVGEAIEPKYAAFSIPQLSLNQVVELFTDANPNIDVPVNLSDLSFHWSDGVMDAVALPDGTLSNGGYGFTAAVDIFSFGFYGEANLDLNKGLTANMQLAPVNWHNVLKLTGDGKGYSLKIDANGNPIPNNFMPTTQAEKDAVASATSKQIVAPGGANLIINTLSMPILHLNARASLFGLLEYDVTADINQDGIKFELDFGAILTEKMVCNLTDFHNLYAEFGYYIDKSIPLTTIEGVSVGSIPLKADANVHVTITTSTSDIVISVGGRFDFEGYHFTFGDFSADINISKISDFVGAIIQYLIDEAKTIFKQLTDTAEHWAAAAKNGIITGFDDAGSIMKNAYGKTKEEMTTILKAAGFALNDVVNALKNGYNASANDIASAMKAAGYVANDVANGLKSAYNATADDVTAALKDAGYTLTDVATAIKDVWECAQKDVARVMKAAGYVANDVANGLKSAYNATADDVTAALKDAGYTFNEVATAIKDVWECAQKDVARVMKAAGYVANDVANGLKSAYNATADDVTAALKAAGYTLTEIATAIKDVWECALKDVARVLDMSGCVANDICNAFKSAFNSGAKDIADAFKECFKTYDVTDAIRNILGASINDAASAVKEAGYAADEVAYALKNVFNTSVDAVASAMKDVGYAADDVKNAFEKLGGDFKSFADTAWNDVKNAFNPSNW